MFSLWRILPPLCNYGKSLLNSTPGGSSTADCMWTDKLKSSLEKLNCRFFSSSFFIIDFKICLYAWRFDTLHCPHDIFWLHFANSHAICRAAHPCTLVDFSLIKKTLRYNKSTLDCHTLWLLNVSGWFSCYITSYSVKSHTSGTLPITEHKWIAYLSNLDHKNSSVQCY